MLSSLILHNHKNHFSIWLWCVTESGCYRTTGDDQLSGWTKKKLWSSSQSQTYTKKTGHGLYLVVCCLSDPLQLSESQWNHYIWEVHLAIKEMHWRLQCLPAGIGQQKGPNSSPRQCPTTHCITNASEVEWTGLQSFASFTTSTWPIANWLPLLQASQQLFAGKMLSKSVKSQSMDFYATGINKHFSLAKTCWLQWFLFWLINMCLSLVIMI